MDMEVRPPLERMWLIVRKTSPFEVEDVCQMAEVSESEASEFIRGLEATGYLQRFGASAWRLVKDTGPKPPELGIYAIDGNTGEFAPKEVKPRLCGKSQTNEPKKNVLEPILVFVAAESGVFDLAEAVRATGLERRKVLRVLDKLEKEGRIKKLGEDRVFTGEPGPGRRNPRWKVQSGLQDRPVKQQNFTQRDRMWAAVRKLEKFTYATLSEVTGVKIRYTQMYVSLLELYGFVRCCSMQGHGNLEKVFQLISDPGPARPWTPEKQSKREDKTNG